MAKLAVAAAKYPLLGVFDTPGAAERAYQSCLGHGYELGEVNVVVSEGTRQKLLSSDHEIKAELGTREAQGGELGGPKGGRTGMLITIAAAVGTAVAVPAIGFAAGPLAIALIAAGAAGAAGVTGGLIGAFRNWGISPASVEGYEADIRKGAILMSVEARSAADAKSIAGSWRKLGGRDIHLEQPDPG